MGDLKKALKKFNNAEKAVIKNIITRLKTGSFSARGGSLPDGRHGAFGGENLDIKKLQGVRDIYRVRKGSIRILFYFEPDKTIKIFAVDRRSDKTYNF